MAILCPRCNAVDSEYSAELNECARCSEDMTEAQARRTRIFNNTKHLLCQFDEDVEFVLTAPATEDADDSSIGELSTWH